MDIFSHGLWSAAVYKGASLPPRHKKKIGWAVFFGVAPDLFSFGLIFISTLFATGHIFPQFIGEDGVPHPDLVPSLVHIMYNLTHSLVVFALVCALVWFLRKKPFWEMGAWGLHILSDIPTHTSAFFPTPFLWPFSSFHVSGIQWSSPTFLVWNFTIMALVYIALFIYERKRA